MTTKRHPEPKAVPKGASMHKWYARDAGFRMLAIEDEEEVLICYVATATEADENHAHLISAAPDLLEALRAIARDSEDELSQQCALEAITKATGGK